MSRLQEIWEQLNGDERAVLLRVADHKRGVVGQQVDHLLRGSKYPDVDKFVLFTAERLLMGRTQYGPLDIATDKRDWAREALEEEIDLEVYRSIGRIAREKAGK